MAKRIPHEIAAGSLAFGRSKKPSQALILLRGMVLFRVAVTGFPVSEDSIKRMCWLVVMLTTVLVAGGCADSSPVTPDREPLVFTGILASESTDSHPLPLLRSGTIRIELTELTAIFVQVEDKDDPSLVLGVGIGAFDDEELCIPTLRPTFSEGGSTTVLPSVIWPEHSPYRNSERASRCLRLPVGWVDSSLR